MKVAYSLIRAEGETESFTADFNGEPESWYRQLRDVFAQHFGDEIFYEHVNVWHQGRYADMLVDETGSLKGLPVNEKASEIYHANVKAHFPDEFRSDMPMIYGDALLFEQKVWL